MIVQKLKQRLSSRFIRNAGWLGLAELFNRFFRLGTTVVLARFFTPYDYGLLAILYLVHSFAEVFTSKFGIGAKIVQAKSEELESICNTTYWISWMLCCGIFLLQCIASAPIAWIYKENQLILPICILGLKYLILPTFKIQSSLLKRENKLKIQAIANTVDSLTCNIITIALVLVGLEIWAIVIAMIFSTVFSSMIYRRYSQWVPPSVIEMKFFKEVINFGGNMLGISFLDQLRMNLDYLIVGHFLSVEELGLYFFAFNAGIGISQNVIQALISSLFPHLCEVRENLGELKQRYFSSIKTIATVLIPIVLLQSGLAPFYVPLIFGTKWINAIPILSIICLSAIPLAFALGSYQLLNAVGHVKITLIWNSIYTALFAIVILVAVRWGIFSVAVAVLMCQAVTLIFSMWATRYVLASEAVRVSMD